jgi:hypothetical protein
MEGSFAQVFNSTLLKIGRRLSSRKVHGRLVRRIFVEYLVTNVSNFLLPRRDLRKKLAESYCVAHSFLELALPGIFSQASIWQGRQA